VSLTQAAAEALGSGEFSAAVELFTQVQG